MRILLLFIMMFSLAFAKEDKEIKQLSEALGQVIGKNLDDLGVEIDIKRMIKGIKKASNKKSPPISEKECFETISLLQKKILKKVNEKNLKEANKFLAKNINEKNIIEVEKNKLQYKILTKGSGNIVNSYNNPIVKYTGRYLDGTIFASSEEILTLNETILGLQKAIIGMKEGEERTIYIHPDFGFQNTSTPNNLLIFDVKLIKADAKNLPSLPNEIAQDRSFQ